MKNEQKFNNKLTKEEIQAEIKKVGDFFNQIPEDMKTDAASMFIQEIVNWACRDYYQGIGIFYEAMNSFREISLLATAEMVQQEELENAFKNAQDYRCLQEMDRVEDPIAEGVICKIGCVGKNEQYARGKKYIIFREDGTWTDLCQHRLDDHFELAN